MTETTYETKLLLDKKFNQFDQIIQQRLTESNKQLEAKLKEADAEKQKLKDELEEKNNRQKTDDQSNLLQFGAITSEDFQKEKQRAVDEVVQIAITKREAEHQAVLEEREAEHQTVLAEREAEKQTVLTEREAEKQRALEAKKKLKQRIHELEQQIALPKIKPATPPKLLKQALMTSIASLCSPPKPYDA